VRSEEEFPLDEVADGEPWAASESFEALLDAAGEFGEEREDRPVWNGD
jgi:hypothetical protein